jgi:hypothetical protein
MCLSMLPAVLVAEKSAPLQERMATEAYDLYSAIYRDGGSCEPLEAGEVIAIEKDSIAVPD